MREPTGTRLIERYKRNYGIAPDADLTEEQILRHWELERRLTRELVESSPENRWETFERCYSTLYGELAWLNELCGAAWGGTGGPPAADWTFLIGPPPRRVYEIGSGKGRLISALAERGYVCKGTEITRERGEKWVAEHPSLSWGVTDGVHLDRHEPPGTYDAVVSDQVIEHLHPDDVFEHLRSAHAILRSGGRYAFATPNAIVGPADVSRVFGATRPMGMHLREYTYREMRRLLHGAGFHGVAAPFKLPWRLRSRLGGRPWPYPNRPYFAYLCLIEAVLARLPRRVRLVAARAARAILWTPGIVVVAFKR